MTIFFVCSVRDSAIGAYDRPFLSPSVDGAKRAFADAVNDPQTALHKHPEDYELFTLGTFDDSSARFSLTEPTSVCTGKMVAK